MSNTKPDIISDHREGRVLIVDDDVDFALSLVDILESRGYQVEVAHDAPSGREKAERLGAQVALVDIRLRRDSGLDLIGQLKEARPGILCVMMTAYAAMDTAIEAIHGGAYDYLQKPLDMRYLLTTLDRCFDRLRLESEKAEAEAERERLRHLLQNVTDSMPSALVALDPEGQVLLWNPAVEALTGKAAAQTEGQLLWRACPELDRYRDLFERVLREGQVARRHKEQLVTESGTVYRNVDVFPLAVNEIEGAVLRIDDVTDRVRIEEMMLQSAKMAGVGRLAAGVAHEINNPLAAMMQSAQVLQLALDVGRSRTRKRVKAAGVDPEGLERYVQARDLMYYLEGIREAGARAAKIVTDLLSFSRKSASQFAEHDLNALLEKTLDLAVADYDLKRNYDFRDIEVVRELASDLPSVVCDGQQIQQVVLNLLRNAAQAMADMEADQEYQPRLTLHTEHEDDWVRLVIEDNGPGIPEAAREHLFEPFFTTKDVGEGTGLGLWVCWSIVKERHKGRIRVEEAAGGGSRFVVELPLIQA